jgi:hypothetical protein
MCLQSGGATEGFSEMAQAWFEMKSSHSVRLLFLAFLLVGLFLRVGAAIRFPNEDWPDEIFQTQEPAHRLAYGYGVVTWEWREGVRSWVFPAFLAGVMRATDWMSSGSAGYQLGMAIVLSLISLTTVWFGFAWARRASGTQAALIAAGACAIWYELIYFAPKTLNEVMAAHALLPGLYLGRYGERLQEKKRMFLAGIFCGLAMSLRIQLAPAVGFAALYFCYPNWRKRTLPLAAGLLLPVLSFGLVDMVTWSSPFHSYIYYYLADVKRVFAIPNRFRREPWHWFVDILLLHLGPVALLVIMGIRRSPFLGWVALTILVSHSVFAHKELRWLYPLMPLEITLAALGVVEIVPALNAWRKSPLSPRAIVAGGLAFLALNSCFLVPEFNWSRMAGPLVAFDRLSGDSTLCGVGVYGIGWWNIGGYAHLHENVPIIILEHPSELKEETASFNALVTAGSLADLGDGFELTGCWHGACVYRRPGPCTSVGEDNEINSMLRRTRR